jgi:hypothetical protein
MSQSSTNNIGWKNLFDHLPIRQNTDKFGVFSLTAKQIKEIGLREPRSMTKFDLRNQRPRLLADHGITILPVTNGEYLLLTGDGYFDLPADKHIETYDGAKVATLQTIPWRKGIRSEPQAIDTLFMASALRTFVDDDSIQLTLRGKLRSHRFSFKFRTRIKEERVTVDGVQIEVDAGFEGKKVVLLEAKYGAIDNFLVRQLYYPYRDLLESGVTKEITPILLVYSNRVYSLYAFKFSDVDSYQSAKLIRQVNYTLEELRTIPRLADVLSTKRTKAPTDVPFPQADDLSKVFDVTDILAAGPASKEDIAERFDVDPRQGDYYANAAAWLGFVEKSGSHFALTKEGKKFIASDRVDRIAQVAERLCEREAFAEAAEAFVARSPLDTKEIADIIARKYPLSGATPIRRAATVRSWIQWLAGQLRQ